VISVGLISFRSTLKNEHSTFDFHGASGIGLCNRDEGVQASRLAVI
jgi:hypothetical protein